MFDNKGKTLVYEPGCRLLCLEGSLRIDVVPSTLQERWHRCVVIGRHLLTAFISESLLHRNVTSNFKLR